MLRSLGCVIFVLGFVACNNDVCNKLQNGQCPSECHGVWGDVVDEELMCTRNRIVACARPEDQVIVAPAFSCAIDEASGEVVILKHIYPENFLQHFGLVSCASKRVEVDSTVITRVCEER